MEEEHSNVLASDSVPGIGRTGHPIEIGEQHHWPWANAAQQFVAHGRHEGSGEIAVERSAECGLERANGIQMAAAASTEDRVDSIANIRRREYGGRFGQRVRYHAERWTPGSVLLLAREHHLVRFGLSMQ